MIHLLLIGSVVICCYTSRDRCMDAVGRLHSLGSSTVACVKVPDNYRPEIGVTVR